MVILAAYVLALGALAVGVATPHVLNYRSHQRGLRAAGWL